MITFADILSLFLILCGLFILLFPELNWKLQHLFTVKGGEPTFIYIVTARISGALMIIIALLIYFRVINFLGIN